MYRLLLVWFLGGGPRGMTLSMNLSLALRLSVGRTPQGVNVPVFRSIMPVFEKTLLFAMYLEIQLGPIHPAAKL